MKAKSKSDKNKTSQTLILDLSCLESVSGGTPQQDLRDVWDFLCEWCRR